MKKKILTPRQYGLRAKKVLQKKYGPDAYRILQKRSIAKRKIKESG